MPATRLTERVRDGDDKGNLFRERETPRPEQQQRDATSIQLTPRAPERNLWKVSSEYKMYLLRDCLRCHVFVRKAG